MFDEKIVPNGEPIGRPPANGAVGCSGSLPDGPPGGAVWQPAQSAAFARYSPFAISFASFVSYRAEGVWASARSGIALVASNSEPALAIAIATAAAIPVANRARLCIVITMGRR